MRTPDWQSDDGRIQLYCGDNALLRDDLPADTAIISDPPYGMNWNTNTTRFSGGNQAVSRGKDWGAGIAEDDRPFDPTPWIGFRKVVLFGANHFASRLPVGTSLVWVKRNDKAFGSFLSDGELAWMKGGHGLYCFRSVPTNRSRGLHPTQKPVELMEWCMVRAKVPATGAIVCDPYSGSFTTAVACIRTNRRFVGIEKERKYFDIGVERCIKELARQPLLEAAQ